MTDEATRPTGIAKLSAKATRAQVDEVQTWLMEHQPLNPGSFTVPTSTGKVQVTFELLEDPT